MSTKNEDNAQPSPGGQGALDCIGRIEEAIEFRVPHDIYAAVHGELAELKAALAARQPGGPDLQDELLKRLQRHSDNAASFSPGERVVTLAHAQQAVRDALGISSGFKKPPEPEFRVTRMDGSEFTVIGFLQASDYLDGADLARLRRLPASPIFAYLDRKKNQWKRTR